MKSEKENVVPVDDRYSVVIGEYGGLRALRYGEPWRDLTGDKFVYSMAFEIETMRELIVNMYEATGAGSSEESLQSAHADITRYVEALPRSCVEAVFKDRNDRRIG